MTEPLRHVVLAHGGGVQLPNRWTPDLWIIAGLCCACALYARGTLTLRERGAVRTTLRQRSLCFALGIATLVLALLSPLDGWSDGFFSAHMLQHELLMLMAAPLFVLARPLQHYLWALPRTARARVLQRVQSPGFSGLWRVVSAPLFALLTHGIVRWIWHVPLLFEACLRNETLHGFQHATFFVTAMLFWWSIVQGGYGRLGYGVSVLFVFMTALHTGALGVLIAVAARPWYPLYAQRTPGLGGDTIVDQQLAGLIMWVVAGTVLTILALALFMAWLGEAKRRARRGSVAQLLHEETS